MKLGNIKHDFKSVNILAGEQKSEEYTKNVNPRGKVPVLVDGDFKLTESTAIAKYLLTTRKDAFPATLWPEDPKKRARVDALLEYYSCHFRPQLLGPLIIGIKLMNGLKPEEEFGKFMMEGAKKGLETLEKILELSGGPYVTGADLTVADLFLFHETLNVIMGKEDEVRDVHPLVKKWVAKMQETKEVKEVHDEFLVAIKPIKEKLSALQP